MAILAGLCAAAPASASGGVEDVDINTSVASEAQIRAAQPITSNLDADSVAEPNVCKSPNGDGPLTKLFKERDASAPEGDGLSVSPAAYALKGLLPNTTYRACVIVRSLTDDPRTIVIDDVDLQAATEVGAGVELIDESHGVGSWIVPATRSFVAQKGYTYNIPFIIRTPAVLPAGTVIGGVRVIRASSDVKGAGAKTQFAVNQRIYISMPGGTREELRVQDLRSNRLITGAPGKAAFHTRFTLRNRSDYLTTYKPTLKVTGLGRTVATQALTGSSMLPRAAERVEITQRDLPWIGIYRPTMKIETSEGPITRKLPLVVVLPPLIYTIALIIAILLPIGYFTMRSIRRRREWLAYLAYEMEHGSADDAAEDDVASDERWDPAAH
jgi:hypothetical protein